MAESRAGGFYRCHPLLPGPTSGGSRESGMAPGKGMEPGELVSPITLDLGGLEKIC